MTTIQHSIPNLARINQRKIEQIVSIDPKRGRESVKLVFLPPSVTSLAEYEVELTQQGVSPELTKDIIEGLSDSPLYEGQAS